MTPDSSSTARDERGDYSGTTAAVLWCIWLLGCVIAVIGCWLLGTLSVITFFGTDVTPRQTAEARGWINTAPILSAVSAAIIITIAIFEGRKHKLSTAAVMATVVAVLSPWPPLILALEIQITGE